MDMAGHPRLRVYKAVPAGWEGWKETHIPVLLPHSRLKVGPLWRRDSSKSLPELLEAFEGFGRPRPSYTAQGTSSVAVGALASIPGCREEKVPLNFQDLCSRSRQTTIDTILNRTDL